MKRLLIILAVFGAFYTVPAAAQTPVVVGTPIQIPIQPIRLKPDLVINNFAVTAPAVLHCGSQTITYTFTESNIGNAPAPSYTNYIYVNGGAAIAVARGSLAAGATRTATLSGTFYNGPCDCLPTNYTVPIYMKADGPNTVNEKNESNNNSNTVIQAAACP